MYELSKPKGRAKYTPPQGLHWQCPSWLLWGGARIQALVQELERNTISKGILEPHKVPRLKHDYKSTICPFTARESLKELGLTRAS